ncbi:unnamed protein product [Calicophoron daubneyi]|uniref:RING-type domain-containing protein n=1 Tax=Calicophoron daubneyi TaxID=300641 RepID=A0AAV2T569_CALDB
MDELHRLYEHQTMMAIGIYSFLDNLLSHIPPRPDDDSRTTANVDYPPGNSQPDPVRIGPSVSELAGNLMEISRPDSFRERHERIRVLPRLTTWSTNERASSRVEATEGGVVNQDTRVEEDGEVAEPAKVEVNPGGYPEEIFIYLSEREKVEYTCTICYMVSREPYQCRNEHRFCYGCIYTWSTGPSVGHDVCPVCRCDGLYAKNFDLGERINRKRVRCTKGGCNWMGVLSDHEDHEHRRYSPYELDILLSGCKKEPVNKPLGASKEVDEGHITELSKKPKSPPVFQAPSEATASAMMPSSEPPTCAPLRDTIEIPEDRREETAHQSPRLIAGVRTGRSPRVGSDGRTHIQPTQRRRNVRNGTSSTSSTDRLRRNPSRPSHTQTSGRISSVSSVVNGPSTHSSENRPHALHSTVSAAPRTSDPARRATSTTPNRHVHRTTRSRPIVGLNMETNQTVRGNPAEVNRHSTDLPPPTPSRGQATSRRPSHPITHVQTAAGADQLSVDRVQLAANLNQTTVCEVPGPSAVSETQAETSTGEPLTVQTMLRPSISTTTTTTNDQNQVTRVRTSGVTLPAINPSANLTNPNSCRLLGSNVTTGSTADTENSESRLSRPLEFRRLVPRRPGRVVEQLRETREQLAAMLRLMTMELEERRQHVLAATSETSSRSRLIHNLNTQATPEEAGDGNRSAQEERTTAATVATEPNDYSSNSERQNHHLLESMQVLRNLPTPERSPRWSYQARIQNLLGSSEENLNSFSDSSTHTTAPNRLPQSHMNTIDRADNAQSSSIPSVHNRNNSGTTGSPRLLNRLRHNRQSVPSVLLVSRRRNIAALLSDLRNPYSYANVWSSDEDEETIGPNNDEDELE